MVVIVVVMVVSSVVVVMAVVVVIVVLVSNGCNDGSRSDFVDVSDAGGVVVVVVTMSGHL